MATSKSKVNTRKNRVRSAHRSKAAPPEYQEPIDWLRGRESSPTTLEEAIEQERGRLNRATSLLACLKYALQYAEEFEDDVDRPSLADLAAFAHELVADAINRLDTVYIGHLPRSEPMLLGQRRRLGARRRP